MSNYTYHTHVNSKDTSLTSLQSRNELNSYIIGRSNLFNVEYGSSPYSKKASEYDTLKGTIFAICTTLDTNNESFAVGGMAGVIYEHSEPNHRLPIFNKYSKDYTSISLIEEISQNKKTAEIYGVWRNPEHSGKGISEELYKRIYEKLKVQNVDYVLATLTPKNVEPYLRQASVNSDKYHTLILKTDIMVTNTDNQQKPRVAVIAFSEKDGLYYNLLNSKNACTTEQYLIGMDQIKKQISDENDGNKPSTAVVLEYLNKLHRSKGVQK